MMEKIVSLAKRRGFIFPGSEIYGGLAGTWDYGPLGVELKNNIKQMWWKRFVQQRDDMVGIDSAIIMNPKVWEASGHVETFEDLLVECKYCHKRFRADEVGYDIERTQLAPGVTSIRSTRIYSLDEKCPACDKPANFTSPKRFNLLFETQVGPINAIDELYKNWRTLKDRADSDAETEKLFTAIENARVHLRPETAQGMFVNFKNVLDTMRPKLPFGVAQIGKAFRNEITPRDFIFRSREFEQMEIEYFVRESEWTQYFDHWLDEMRTWIADMGIDTSRVHELEVPEDERAHYSKRTVDFEYDFPFGKKELYGLAYRGDFDLQNHARASGTDLRYTDPETGEKFLPHVIEPTWGVDRTVLAVLLSAYHEDGERVVLKLHPRLAPYKAAVFPLLANKPQLVEKARQVYNALKQEMPVAWDDRGNIGKRYYAQDEIGTPWCITIDFQTLEDDTVTVRDRDTAKQERILVKELSAYILKTIHDA